MNRLRLPWNNQKKTGESEASDSPAADTQETSPKDSPDPEESSDSRRRKKPPVQVPVHRWFVTLMCMNIPVIGWLYLIILALSPSKGPRREFAKAYLLYKLLFLTITLIILARAFHYGMELLDKVLAYMEML